MSISILASEHGDTLYYILIPLAFLGYIAWHIPLLGLIRSIDTDHRSILKIVGNTLAVVGIGVIWIGATGGIYNLSQERFEVEEKFASTVERELGISEMLPVEEAIDICSPGSKHNSSEYAWIDQNGAAARGTITKTAEVDGQCLYTFQATA